jgi:hypothetical protein
MRAHCVIASAQIVNLGAYAATPAWHTRVAAQTRLRCRIDAPPSRDKVDCGL